jgi:hypothetical protein
VRLLGRFILVRMARAHRHAREIQPRHQLADRALVQLHAEPLRDLVAQVGQAPAHQLAFRWRSLPHPLCDVGFLLRRQLARRLAGVASILQSGQAALIVTMHPIAQRLPVHAGTPSRVASALTFQNKSNRKHASRRRDVLAPSRRAPKLYWSETLPRHRNRHLSVPPLLSPQRIAPPRVDPNHDRVNASGGWYQTVRDIGPVSFARRKLG